MPSFEIVAAAENNNFFLWQALLFHYSCLTYQRQAPIIVVHARDEEELLPGFEHIIRTGGRVQRAPNWRVIDGINYPPRNTISTLKHVQTTADYIVLCDADMLFRRPFDFSSLPIDEDVMTFDRVFYMNPRLSDYQPFLTDACRAANVPIEWFDQFDLVGGVPHVIPRCRQQQVADEWLHCISYFPTQAPCRVEEAGALSRGVHQGTQQWWLSIMWAAFLMTQRLNLQPQITDFCLLNLKGEELLPDAEIEGPAMIHYCYPGPGFNKHLYDGAAETCSAVWQVAEEDQTVNGLVRRQLREARHFYLFDFV